MKPRVFFAVLSIAALSLGAGPPTPSTPPPSGGAATSTTEQARIDEEREKRRLEDLAKEYEAVNGTEIREDRHQPEAAPERSLFGAFFQMVLVLGAVCALAYLLLGKLLPKLMKIEPPLAQHRIMQVIDRMPLDQRRSILVIRIGEAYYLVGASEHGISLLSRLDGDDVLRALASAESKAPPQLGRLAGLLMKRPERVGKGEGS